MNSALHREAHLHKTALPLISAERQGHFGELFRQFKDADGINIL